MPHRVVHGLSPFAKALRQARSSRYLTKSDVAKRLLLSENQVSGLEGDDLSAFYSPVYAERAARRYAAFLEVDAELEGAPRKQPVLQPSVVAPVTSEAPVATARPGWFRRWGFAMRSVSLSGQTVRFRG